MIKNTYNYDRKQAVNKDTAQNTYGNATTTTTPWLKYYRQLNSDGSAEATTSPYAGYLARTGTEPEANKWQRGGLSQHGTTSTAVKNTLNDIKALNSYVGSKGTATDNETSAVDETAAGATTKQPLSYADYLEKYGMTEATGATMSYADYLARTGTDTEKDYQRAVRQAETDYAKARAGYGSTGETLARAGMNASGYSDYITGAGFAAMQNAKVAAADTKALADATNAASYADYVEGKEAEAASYNNSLRQSYASYLMNEEAEQKAADQALEAEQKTANQTLGSYVNSLAADGADAATIRARAQAYATAMGYSLPDNLEDMITSSLAAYATTTPAEQASVKSAMKEIVAAGLESSLTAAQIRQQLSDAGYSAADIEDVMSDYSSTIDATAKAAALEVVNSGVENQLSGQQITQQLKQAGYSEEVIESVMTDYHDRTELALAQNIARASTLSELYPEDGFAYSNKNIDTWVAEGEISEAQGAALKATLAEKRISALNSELDNSTTDEEVITTINNIVTLNRAGDITDDDVRSLMSRIGSESVQAVINKSQKSYRGEDKIGEPVVELLDQYNDVGENESYYTKVGAEAIQGTIAESISVGEVKHTENEFYVDIQVDNGPAGQNTTETIEFSGTKNKSGKLPNHADSNYVYSHSTEDGLYTYGGTLYVRQGNVLYTIHGISHWSIGSKQNADTLMEILKSKATSLDINGTNSRVTEGAVTGALGGGTR